MIKRLMLVLVLLAFGATAALAAPVKGKVAAVDKNQVQVIVTSKLPDWVKKGLNVRFLGGKSLVVSVSADTVTISTPRAAKAKPGQVVTIEKPRPGVSGC